jgi:hypothetical protein
MKNLLTLFCFLLLILLAIGPGTNDAASDSPQIPAVQASGAKPYKYIGKQMTFPNEPIEISDLKLKGKVVSIDTKLKEKDDWLNGLTFKIRNKSGKRIVYLSLHILLPETRTAPNQPVLAFPLKYGADPILSRQPTVDAPLGINDEIEFRIVGPEYENLKQFVEKKTPLKNINFINIDIVMAIFDDDTAWDSGSILRRDPNNPRRWVDIN